MKGTRHSGRLLAAAFTSVTAVALPAFADIVQNGGFETADPGQGAAFAQNWNGQNGTTILRDTTNPHSGVADEYLNLNTGGGGNLFLFQDTPAGSVTAGSVYTLNFYAAGNFANSGEGQYQVVFFGANGPNFYSGVKILNAAASPSTYTLNTLTLPAAPAGSNFAEIQFNAVTGAVNGAVAQLYLDDVSLSAPAVVAGGPSVYNLAGSGDYNVATNWTNGVPNAIGAEADFFGSITAPHTVYSDIAVTVGTLNFNNANTYVLAGAGSMTLQAASGSSASVIVQSGTQKINLPLTIASNTALNVSSGATLLISDPVRINPGVAVTNTGSGTVTYQSTVSVGAGSSFALGNSTAIHALSLAANATATLSGVSTGRLLLQTDSLTLDPTASLDLTRNDLVVHGGNLASVVGSVKTGSATGAGIKSSAATGNGLHNTTLGVISNNDGNGNPLFGAGTTAGTFDSTSPALNDVLVRYTYYGDTNFDGKVDGSDYARLDNGFNKKLTGWLNGDLNYDGVVDGSDYTLIDNAFNTQTGVIASAATPGFDATSAGQFASSAVPEPASAALALVGLAGLIGRRRRFVA